MQVDWEESEDKQGTTAKRRPDIFPAPITGAWVYGARTVTVSSPDRPILERMS